MNPYFLIGALLAVIAAGTAGYLKGDAAGRATVRAEWNEERRQQSEQHARDLEAARAKEQELQEQADRVRKEKDEQIRNSEARAVALINSLRSRPEQPAQGGAAAKGSQAGQAPAGCDGTGLWRSHGEFLAREAARANQLRSALKECYARVDALTEGQN